MMRSNDVVYLQIVLQKSKVAGPRFFRKNTKQEINRADSYNLNRVTEVACAFYAKAMRFLTLHESRACSPQNF